MQNEDLKFKALVDAVKQRMEDVSDLIKQWEKIKEDPVYGRGASSEINRFRYDLAILQEVLDLAEAVERDEKEGLL